MKHVYLFIALLFMAGPVGAQTWDWAISNTPSFDGVLESSPTAVDLAGNVYSAGMVFGTDSVSFGSYTVTDTVPLHQLVIVKANAAGALQWVFNTEHSLSQPVDMATDAAGDLYVLGTYFDTGCNVGPIHLSNAGSGIMFFMFKLSAAGTVLWAQNIANASSTLQGGIGVDAERYVYVTGSYGAGGATIGTTTLTNANPANNTSDIFIAKYNTLGNPIWAKGFGGAMGDVASYIAVHSSGTFYIAGQFSSDTLDIDGTALIDSDYVPSLSSPAYFPFFAKFDRNGNNTWAKTPYRHVRVMDIQTDDALNCYLGGSIDSTLILGKDTLLVSGMQSALLSKYDPAANIVWSNTAQGKQYSLIYSMDIDACGNVWVGGSTDTIATRIDGQVINAPTTYSDRMYLAAFDHCGRYIPSSGTALGSGGDDRLDIVLDHMGHLYLGGDYNYIPMKFGADSLLAPSTATQEYFLLARYTYGPMPCSTAPCCYITPYANFTDTGSSTINFQYTGGSTYDSLRWDFGDTTTSAVTNPVHSFAPGNYHVCLTVYTSCGNDTMCKDITIATAGLTNVRYDNDVSLFPNPASGAYAIRSTNGFATGTSLTIYDITGKHINTVALAGYSQTFSLTGYAPGVYQCVITLPDNTIIKKSLMVK